MKTIKIKISKNSCVAYVLAKENSEYSIICIEESSYDGKLEIYRVPRITNDKSFAKRLFKKLIKNKVSGVTLHDVVTDLIS